MNVDEPEGCVSISRREVLLGGATAGAVVGAGVLVPLGFVIVDDGDNTSSTGATGARLATFDRVEVGSVSALAVGEPVFFDYPFEGASNILVRLGEPTIGASGPDRDIVAFSVLCTHMGCPITEYHPETHVLGPCPCHFSSFDLGRDGIAALGQATQNLARVRLEIEDDAIVASGVFRLVYGHSDNLTGVDLVAVAEGSQS